MSENSQFIAKEVLGHVYDFDNDEIARAFQDCDESSCDVRTYGSASSPNTVRFFSHSMRSPDGGFWWNFTRMEQNELLSPMEMGLGVTSNYVQPPYWHLDSVGAPPPQDDLPAES